MKAIWHPIAVSAHSLWPGDSTPRHTHTCIKEIPFRESLGLYKGDMYKNIHDSIIRKNTNKSHINRMDK